MSERAKIRKQLSDALRTDDDVNRFLVDYFPDVAAKRSNGMTTDAKITLLIESIDVKIISSKLKKHKSEMSRSIGESEELSPVVNHSEDVANSKRQSIADCVDVLDELEIEHFPVIENSVIRAWARDSYSILEKCLPGHHITEEFSRLVPFATPKNIEEFRNLLSRAKKAIVRDGLLSKIDPNARAKTELTIVDARRQLPFHPYTHPRPKPGSLR